MPDQAEAQSQQPYERAHVAIVGDADRFNIGQDGYCGKRTEIDSPSSVSFQVPGAKRTWFYIRTKFRTPIQTTTCEGDFSFTPEPGRLHIIRFLFREDTCTLEMFRAIPGENPVPAEFKQEQRRICLPQ